MYVLPDRIKAAKKWLIPGHYLFLCTTHCILFMTHELTDCSFKKVQQDCDMFSRTVSLRTPCWCMFCLPDLIRKTLSDPWPCRVSCVWLYRMYRRIEYTLCSAWSKEGNAKCRLVILPMFVLFIYIYTSPIYDSINWGLALVWFFHQ